MLKANLYIFNSDLLQQKRKDQDAVGEDRKRRPVDILTVDAGVEGIKNKLLVVLLV